MSFLVGSLLACPVPALAALAAAPYPPPGAVAGVVASAAAAAGAVGAAADATADTERQEAVAAARAGRLEHALAHLERLHARYPGERAVRFDLAVVSAWAGRDARTVALLETVPLDSQPDYVLESYARALRNLQRWDDALSAYARLARRVPERLGPRLGRALVLADAGRSVEARRALAEARQRIPAGDPIPAAFHAACGYVHEQAGRLTAALTCYGDALAADPEHRDARRRYVLAASALGAAHQALTLARAHPGLLAPPEMARLELDAAAQQVRWAGLPEAERGRAHARAALAAHDALEGPRAPPLDEARARTRRFDRIVALVADYRMAEAVTEFEALQATTPEPLPVYVLAAAARAYLYLERPASATAAYEAALADAPERFDLRLGLFFARSDLHDHAGARAVAEELLATEPAWQRPAPGRWQANPRHAQARELAALELAYRDRYDEALAQFDAMLDLAPASTALRLSRAELLRWRGWHAAARRDLQRVRLHEPDNLRATTVEGHLALDTRRYRAAEQAVTTAVRRAPDAKATLELVERWRRHQSPELQVSAGAGRSEGSAFAGRDWRTELRWLSAPLAHRWRVTARDTVRYGRFAEGIGRDHRLAAGLEYRAPRWSAQAELTQGIEQNQRPGVAAAVRWHHDDRLTLEAKAAANAEDVPLRAIRVGVQGDALKLGASYRWHEARAASLTAGWLELDDGNSRRWLAANHRWRLVNQPRHKLTGHVRAWGSRNSGNGRVYFNPEADRELALGLTHQWRLLRRYDRGLVQRLGLEVGDYWQQGFGGRTVWTATLAHDWAIGPRTRLGYGVRVGGRVYDGDPEDTRAVFARLERAL